MNYVIERDPEISSAALAGMTFPTFRFLLDRATVPEGVEVHRFVAIDSSGEPLGLWLGTREKSDPGADIILRSLFVVPEARNRGLATALMGQAITELAQAGEKRISVNFTDGKPAIEWFEKVLRKSGWSVPEPKMVLIKCDFDQITTERPLWYRGTPLDPGQEIVLWSEVSEAQMEEFLKSQEEEHWVPDDLMPAEYDYLGKLEETTSLALLQNGKIAGWMLTHAISPKILRFTCGYVRPELQRRGRLFSMLRRSIDDMAIKGFKEGIWTSPVSHRAMHRFVVRRMAPHALYCRHTKDAHRDLP